jgi:hypothetical protein
MKAESETVTLELPKNVMELLRASFKNVKAYLEFSLVQSVRADLENDQVFKEALQEKYDIS